MEPDIATIAKGLSDAQKRALASVCRSNGGGVSVRCRVGPDGFGIPLHGPTRALFEKGLIQGKAGSYEKVVHTRDGLAVRDYLRNQADD